MKIKLFLFLSFFNTLSYCQKRYEDAYVVTTQNDTIRGQILFEDWDVSPNSFKFIEKKDGVEKTYDITNSREFFVQKLNKSYVHKKVYITYVSEGFVYQSEPKEQKELSIFLEKLLEGPKAVLYRMRADEWKIRYFVEYEGKIEELIRFSYLKSSGGVTHIVDVNKYKGQLQSMCSNALDFNYLPPAFEEKDLKKFIKSYNDCFVGKTIVYETTTLKPTIDLLGTLGGGRDWVDDLDIILGMGFRINFPRKNFNRFAKFNYRLSPVEVPDVALSSFSRGTVQQIELNAGSYFGTRKIKPFTSISFSHYFLFGSERTIGNGMIIHLNAGISFNRKIDIELNRLVSFPQFLFYPQLLVHYYFKASK